MSTQSPITINNIDELIEMMQSQNLVVRWTVLSNIGPEWIGSKREICFYLGNRPLTETDFDLDLKSRLIDLARIPAKSKDHVITGEGDLLVKNGKLEIKYSWYAAIPYQYADKEGNGEGILYP